MNMNCKKAGFILLMIFLTTGLLACGTSYQSSYGFGRPSQGRKAVQVDSWMIGKNIIIKINENSDWDFRRDTVLIDFIGIEFIRWGANITLYEEAEYFVLVSGEDYGDRKAVSIAVVDIVSGKVIASSAGERRGTIVHTYNSTRRGEDFEEYKKAITRAVNGLFQVSHVP